MQKRPCIHCILMWTQSRLRQKLLVISAKIKINSLGLQFSLKHDAKRDFSFVQIRSQCDLRIFERV